MIDTRPNIDTVTLQNCVDTLRLNFPGWDTRLAFKKAAHLLDTIGFTVEGWEPSRKINPQIPPLRISSGMFLHLLDIMTDSGIYENATQKRKRLALAFLKSAKIGV